MFANFVDHVVDTAYTGSCIADPDPEVSPSTRFVATGAEQWWQARSRKAGKSTAGAAQLHATFQATQQQWQAAAWVAVHLQTHALPSFAQQQRGVCAKSEWQRRSSRHCFKAVEPAVHVLQATAGPTQHTALVATDSTAGSPIDFHMLQRCTLHAWQQRCVALHARAVPACCVPVCSPRSCHHCACQQQSGWWRLVICMATYQRCEPATAAMKSAGRSHSLADSTRGSRGRQQSEQAAAAAAMTAALAAAVAECR
jgi:hypothetical protein